MMNLGEATCHTAELSPAFTLQYIGRTPTVLSG